MNRRFVRWLVRDRPGPRALWCAFWIREAARWRERAAEFREAWKDEAKLRRRLQERVAALEKELEAATAPSPGEGRIAQLHSHTAEVKRLNRLIHEDAPSDADGEA